MTPFQHSTPARPAAPPPAEERVSSPRLRAGVLPLWGVILLGVAVLTVAHLMAGCVCQPGGRITVNVGWRSAQCGAATNLVNGVDGGGSPKLEVPLLK